MTLTRDQVVKLEQKLARTDKEIDAHIKKYFPDGMLYNIGDTAEIVKILHIQAECVEALAEKKRELSGS